MAGEDNPADKLALHNRQIRVPDGLRAVKFEEGTVIFNEGNPGDRLYIVSSGLIQISKRGAGGNVVISYVGVGEVFGELALIDDEPRMASARAMQDSECFVIGAEAFRTKIAELDPFIQDTLVVLARSVRSLAGDWVKHRGKS